MTALRPGTVVSISAAPASRGSLSPTGTAFVPYLYDKGKANVPIEANSMTQFIDKLGGRSTVSAPAYDAAEAYFAKGGRRFIGVRVPGPTPVAGVAKALDQSGAVDPGDVALIFTTKEKTEWDNGLNVVIVQDTPGAGTPYTVTITHDVDGTLEAWGSFADRAAAVTFAASGSRYFGVTLGASAENPKSGSYNVTGAVSDYANATDTEWQTAINSITKDYGPGQVYAPGKTTGAMHLILARHALAKNRHALLDVADKSTKDQIKAAVLALYTADDAAATRARFITNWVDIPGVATLPGTTRRIAGSAAASAVIAGNDGKGLSPNKAAAGVTNGVIDFALGVSYLNDTPWTPEETDELTRAGVNTIKVIDGEVVIWGNRTAVNPSGQYASTWTDASNSRLAMAIVDRADKIALPYVFEELDGAGIAAGRFGGELRLMLQEYVNLGSLFVEPANELKGTPQGGPETAFVVDVVTPNSPAGFADGLLKAIVGLRMSAHAELVYVTITKRRITEAVA